MSPSERFSLSCPSLLVSVVLSATCMGLMIPYARALPPLVFGSILFTLVYHSLFLVSVFVNENPGHQPRSYISPLDHPRTVRIVIVVLFWLAIFIHGVTTLKLGNISNTNICLDILSGLESFLTVYIAYLCWKKLRNQRARWESDVEVTIESIVYFRQGLSLALTSVNSIFLSHDNPFRAVNSK